MTPKLCEPPFSMTLAFYFEVVAILWAIGMVIVGFNDLIFQNDVTIFQVYSVYVVCFIDLYLDSYCSCRCYVVVIPSIICVF